MKLRLLILSLALFGSNIALAGGFTHLPRDLGEFRLGMTLSDFKKLTGISPQGCPICIEKETFATIDGASMKRFSDNADIGESVDFFFYDNELYLMSVVPATKDIFLAKKDMSDVYGANAKVEALHDGSEQMRWEDETTVMTMTYRPQENEVYSINIIDWNLKEERDWRESLAFQQENKLAGDQLPGATAGLQ